MLQYKIEALDREDFKALAMALEDIAPLPKRSIKLLSIDNNTISPASLANVLVDLEFAYLL